MHADPVALLPVTQADRSAYQELRGLWGPKLQAMIDNGEFDASWDMQLLARHRTPAPAGDVVRAAQFLSDRLDDLEWMDGELESTLRDYMGHVDPAHARLRNALAASTTTDSAVSGSAEVLREDDLISWLEDAAKKSRTGISFDWVPECEGEPSGFRFMRRHFIGEPAKTLRQAIVFARKALTEGQQS